MAANTATNSTGHPVHGWGSIYHDVVSTQSDTHSWIETNPHKVTQSAPTFSERVTCRIRILIGSDVVTEERLTTQRDKNFLKN